MAEYEALVRALRKVENSEVKIVYIYTDSLLVANQVLGKYKMNNERLKPYLQETNRLSRNLTAFEIKYIPRDRIADKLAKDAAAKGVDVWSRGNPRKVRASKGRMVPNGDWEQSQGKCNRKHTAPSRRGKGEKAG